MNRSRWFALGFCLVATCSAVFAQEPSPTLEVVGHLPLRGPRGDIWAHKNFVYIGNWGDTTGVAIIDIADPKNPLLVGNLPTKANTSYEDIHVITVDTPTFKGDLLAVGVQRTTSGVEFWDVTDPRQPKLLNFFRTGGVHELYLLQRGERVLALLAIPDAGMRIVDATDPTQPKSLSLWNLQSKVKINPGLGVHRGAFDHSVSASADGNRAYLSYWDAGGVILDISDPAAPKYLGRTAYAITEEGDTHSAIEADDGRLLITADEDFDPTPAANTLTVTRPGSVAGVHQAIELSVTKQLTSTGTIRGELVYVGSAAIGIDFLADPKGKIALIDVTSEQSQPRAQVLRAQEAGAIAVVVSRSPFRSTSPAATITIPGVGVAKETAEALKTALAAGQKVEVVLQTKPGAWGFLRIWDIQDPGKPVQLGTFATPEALQPPKTPGFYSVHNPVARGTRLYASWYTQGVRVIDIGNPAQPKEIAHFVPPFEEGARLVPGLGGKFSMVWGVVEHNGLLLLSDMQTGLWILRDLPR